MVKLNTLEQTKKLFPHWLDKEDYTNFTKHLKVINHQQQDIRHKLKTVEWSRLLEKPLQLWKTQNKPYEYIMNCKVNVPYLKEVNLYRNPIIEKIEGEDVIVGYEERTLHETYDDDNTSFFEKTFNQSTPVVISTISNETISEWNNTHDDEWLVGILGGEMHTAHIINDYSLMNILYSNTIQFNNDDNTTEHITVKFICYCDYDNLNGYEDADEVEVYFSIIDNETEEFLFQESTIIPVQEIFSNNAEWHNLTLTKNGDIVTAETCGVELGTYDYVNNPFRLYIDFKAQKSFTTEVKNIKRTITEPIRKIIPQDNYLLEVKTWDDYHYLKGYPENDYTVMEDNVLTYQYNTTFLNIKQEQISYSKYLTFRVHKDRIKSIEIFKNDEMFFKQDFINDLITDGKITSSSYTYFDKNITNDPNYLDGEYNEITEVEESRNYNSKLYFADTEQNEFVYRLPLSLTDYNLQFNFSPIINKYPNTEDYIIDTENNILASEETMGTVVVKKEDSSFNAYETIQNNDTYIYNLIEQNIPFEYGHLKDTYDLKVTTYEKRYSGMHEYDKIYSKRYNGYDGDNDCFDHDYSLDVIGNMLNVPRFRFYQVAVEDEEHLKKTYPTFYNRSTEDDYHYMRRIQQYIRNYNHIPFPVLEFWKYYQIYPELLSRKKITGEMDETYFHTNEDIICDSDFFNEEENDIIGESVVEYSTNKATSKEGEGKLVEINNNQWYESVIIKDLYIVPSTDYRLRYGTDNNDVTIRMICYNRQQVELRSTPILPLVNNETNELYNTDPEYNYTDITINMPEDTASVKIILESNTQFTYKDVTFERITVRKLENKYMTTYTEYNSNVYELYADYEDIPTNIRIGGSERFNILLKRSLPLTKKGYLFMDIKTPIQTQSNISTSIGLYVENIWGDTGIGVQDSDIVNTVDDFINGGMDYSLTLQYNVLQPLNDEEYLQVKIQHYNNNNLIKTEILEDEVFSDTETQITYNFTTPPNTNKITTTIHPYGTLDFKEIKLQRTQEIIKEEICT